MSRSKSVFGFISLLLLSFSTQVQASSSVLSLVGEYEGKTPRGKACLVVISSEEREWGSYLSVDVRIRKSLWKKEHLQTRHELSRFSEEVESGEHFYYALDRHGLGVSTETTLGVDADHQLRAVQVYDAGSMYLPIEKRLVCLELNRR